jgi:hypothetical protein
MVFVERDWPPQKAALTNKDASKSPGAFLSHVIGVFCRTQTPMAKAFVLGRVF